MVQSAALTEQRSLVRAQYVPQYCAFPKREKLDKTTEARKKLQRNTEIFSVNLRVLHDSVVKNYLASLGAYELLVNQYSLSDDEIRDPAEINFAPQATILLLFCHL